MKNKVMVLLMGLLLVGEVDADQVVNAAATSAAVQAINIGSAIYMRNAGMQPQYVTLPNGSTAGMPTAPAVSSQDNEPVDSYSTQNQQDNKRAFMSGS